MSAKNFRPTTAAELAADIAALKEPLPAQATEWHRHAQETTLREALAVVEQGGYALRGQDDDGLWYLAAADALALANALVEQSGIPAHEREVKEMDEDEYSEHCQARWDATESLLVEAGFAPGAEVHLDDPTPGAVRVVRL